MLPILVGISRSEARPLVGTPMFFSSFLGKRGRGTDALKSLSLLCLSLLLCN
jgi:hypothetical protein